MIKHINIKVSGIVQGVWYRKSTLEEAIRLGIKGFVRNEPDDSVYIEAEGIKEQLQSLIEWCRKGPELATVDNVEITESSIINFTDFSIT